MFCLDSALPYVCMCMCVCFRIKETEERSEWDSRWMCVWVVSWNESARPWRFYTASGSELLKAAGAAWMKSQYAEMKKNYMERGKQCPAETCWGAVDGPGCSPLQSNSFTRGNIHGSTVSPNKVSIDLNSWTTKARSEWCEAEGLESLEPAALMAASWIHAHMSNAGKGKWLKD